MDFCDLVFGLLVVGLEVGLVAALHRHWHCGDRDSQPPSFPYEHEDDAPDVGAGDVRCGCRINASIVSRHGGDDRENDAGSVRRYAAGKPERATEATEQRESVVDSFSLVRFVFRDLDHVPIRIAQVGRSSPVVVFGFNGKRKSRSD